MTMLDRMRRHKGWLKWSLALVVLTFVVFYIPDFLTTSTGAAPGEVLAEVENESITVGAFQRRYGAQLQAYRNAYGAGMSEDLLRQLGIEQQILQQLIDEQSMVVEAARQGVSVSDVEVRERILAMPAFQENGVFIGEQRYRQVLSFQSPPMTTSEFEAQMRRAIAIEKLRNSLTAWMTLTDAEVAEEFRLRNEKVRLDVVAITPDVFRPQVQVADADLAAYYETHKEAYRVGERRRIKYALVDVDQVREGLTVPDAEIAAFYEANRAQYSTPEEIRASHILLSLDGADAGAVRTRAAALLAEARSGADFAALAREHSQDEGSAVQGGDLDYFGRGRMVPEFEQAAFALEVGQISDVVESPFGFHIIKLTDRRPGTTQPLADVRAEIVDQLRWQSAQQQAEQTARAIEPSVRTVADLERVAGERGLILQESELFLRDEPITGLGPAPEITGRVFEMAEGEVSEATRVARGWVFYTRTGTSEPYVPALDEVRDRVREDVTRERAEALARERATAIAAALKSAPDFAAAARREGLAVSSTELITRGSAITTIGTSPALDAAAFALPVGGVSGPIEVPSGTAVVRVAEREDVTEAQLADGREPLRQELIEARRDRFFSAYMTKAKASMRIAVRDETMARVVNTMR
ncbi:MAG: peptidyl-prolyl cis-trans isomerase [Vicinamibacterales bacterium]|nr:peptidyl-prolyl cis-trans isomerase [Vicinamibacterales bacterium]